jgi:hypothetical protein
MHPKHAKLKFESALAAAGKQLNGLRPGDGIRLMLDFYRTVRAEGCDMERDGDMLLFQYGTHERQFDLDMTRQFIIGGGGDEDIWQLSLRFQFIASPSLESIGIGDRWCSSPSDADEFEGFIATHAAMLAVGCREDGQVRLTYQCVG